MDDVINPSGHRIGTAEVEAAIDELDEVSECAVVGYPHDVKGEGIGVFVILKNGLVESEELTTKCKMAVRSSIGAFATPDFVVFCDLPKTRSGKIMRRVLRKVAHGEVDSIGDTSAQILIKGGSKVKHEVHVSHIALVPVADIVVEVTLVLKQSGHVGDRRHIPVLDVPIQLNASDPVVTPQTNRVMNITICKGILPFRSLPQT